MIRSIRLSRAQLADADWRQWGALALLAGLWLWLFRPALAYLALVFTGEFYRTNQILLAGVLILLAQQVRNRTQPLHLQATPAWRWPPLALALGAAVTFLLVERFLAVNSVATALFGLATYGLLGLWLTPARWRQGLPAALLIIGLLPFGDHLQTFVGYPMRIVTAAIVRDGLAAAGVPSLGVETILVFENGISQVDIPCSGIKSLWSGMLFLLAATWVKRRPFSLRWLLTAVVFVALLFLANLARVAALVIAGPVAGLPFLAEMLHLPLGVLGFVMVCAAAAFMLDRLPAPGQPEMTPARPVSRPAWLTPALIATTALLALAYAPRPPEVTGPALVGWQFPAALTVEPLPLTTDEQAWLLRDGAEAAERWRFNWRGLRGSMILVSSRTWRAHHQPERCFEVYGLALDDSRPHLVRDDFALRFVRLGDDQDAGVLSAGYWFQSAERTTDDYGARIWADLAPQRERWVLVSILFDRIVEPGSADAAALFETLHEAVAVNLHGNVPATAR